MTITWSETYEEFHFFVSIRGMGTELISLRVNDRLLSRWQRGEAQAVEALNKLLLNAYPASRRVRKQLALEDIEGVKLLPKTRQSHTC